jgi:hypothetical protein
LVFSNSDRSPNKAFELIENNTGVIKILIEYEKQELKEKSLFSTFLYTIVRRNKVYKLLEVAKEVDKENSKKEDFKKAREDKVLQKEKEKSDREKWMKE